MKSSAFRNQLNISKVADIKTLSNVGDIYTAHAVIGNEYHALNQDESGIPWFFHSVVEAKRGLPAYAVPIALETSDAYDEMQPAPNRPVLDGWHGPSLTDHICEGYCCE